MDELKVSVDLAHLMQMDGLARVGLFANLAVQVGELAQQGVADWQQAVDAAPGIWQGERDAYKASIRAYQDGPYAWVLVSDYKYVEDIETGRPAYDLKVMLRTSMKVRVSKAGRRYLIIPMRLNTPGNTAHAQSMPPAIYAEAKKLAPSRVTGGYGRTSGTGAYSLKTRQPFKVAARKYVWGERLPAGLAPKLQTRHATDPYAGIVRFKEKTGGSIYMKFRVMAEGAQGWIIPARPGQFLALKVSEGLRNKAQADFTTALQRDLDVAA